MKRRSAALGVGCVLLLAGCRGGSDGGAVAPPPFATSLPSSTAAATGPSGPPSANPFDVPTPPPVQLRKLALGAASPVDPTAESGSVTVTGVEAVKTTNGVTPQKGWFLVVRLTLTAPDDRAGVINPLAFSVEGASGRTTPGDGAAPAASGIGTLQFGALDARGSETGTLVFDSADQHGALLYQPDTAGSPLASWSF
jgi:hypothetical protein